MFSTYSSFWNNSSCFHPNVTDTTFFFFTFVNFEIWLGMYLWQKIQCETNASRWQIHRWRNTDTLEKLFFFFEKINKKNSSWNWQQEKNKWRSFPIRLPPILFLYRTPRMVIGWNKRGRFAASLSSVGSPLPL